MRHQDTAVGVVGLSVDQAAQASGFGRTLLYEAIRDGRLIARKNGRRTVILRSDLDDFLSGLPPIPAKVA